MIGLVGSFEYRHSKGPKNEQQGRTEEQPLQGNIGTERGAGLSVRARTWHNLCRLPRWEQGLTQCRMGRRFELRRVAVDADISKRQPEAVLVEDTYGRFKRAPWGRLRDLRVSRPIFE